MRITAEMALNQMSAQEIQVLRDCVPRGPPLLPGIARRRTCSGGFQRQYGHDHMPTEDRRLPGGAGQVM